MELKQLEYIVEIANEQNITRAAKKLFVTQSALTQQLLKLERELKTPLFYRSRNNWHLTAAGEVYIDNARKILQIKQNTYRAISDITHVHEDNLSIGFAPGRGVAMFANVYPAFHELYPDVTVYPSENMVVNLLHYIKEGKMDIGLTTLPEGEFAAENKYIELLSEKILLIVPSSYQCVKDSPESIDIQALRDAPFVLINKESTMRPSIDAVFRKAGFSPRVLFETSDNPTILTMVDNGLCCSFMSDWYLTERYSNIHAYPMDDMPRWSTYACYKSSNYLSDPAQTFIRMAKEYFAR